MPNKRRKQSKWEKKREERRLEIERHIKVIENGPRAPMTRPGAMEGLKGFKSPRIIFDVVCSTCRGKTEITAISGGLIPCPRCQE